MEKKEDKRIDVKDSVKKIKDSQKILLNSTYERVCSRYEKISVIAPTRFLPRLHKKL